MDYLNRLTDIELLALLIAAESDNQPLAGQVAVACVPLTRLRRGWWGRDLRRVILAPWQFSTFNEPPPGHKAHWQWFTHRIGAYTTLALLAIDGLLASPVPTATHYHPVSVSPTWILSPKMLWLQQIGDHVFYQEVR